MSSKALLEQLKILHQQEKVFIEQEQELLSKVKQELNGSQIDAILLLIQGLNQLRKSLHFQLSDVFTEAISHALLLPFDQTPISIEHPSSEPDEIKNSNEMLAVINAKNQSNTPAVVNAKNQSNTPAQHVILETADTPFIDDLRNIKSTELLELPSVQSMDSNYSPIPILSSPEPMIPQSKKMPTYAMDIDTPKPAQEQVEDIQQSYHSLFDELDASIQTPVDDFENFMPKLPLLDEDEDGDLPPKLNPYELSEEDLISEEILAGLPILQANTPITQSHFQPTPIDHKGIKEDIQQPIEADPLISSAHHSSFDMLKTQVGLPNAFVQPLLPSQTKREENKVSPIDQEGFGKTQLFNPELLKRHDTPQSAVDLFPSSIGQLEGGMSVEIVEDSLEVIPIEIEIEQVPKHHSLGFLNSFPDDHAIINQDTPALELQDNALSLPLIDVYEQLQNADPPNKINQQKQLPQALQPPQASQASKTQTAQELQAPKINLQQASSPQNAQKQINIPILVKVTTQNENKQLICKNLNAGGMFLETTQPYSIGEELFLSFDIRGVLIQVWGMVRWVRLPKNANLEQPAGMGISFMGLKDDDKNRIEAFI